MRIIPAIDIIDGKCVRLTKGDYTQQKIYNENPLEVAKMFEDFGIKYLHLVDLDGAKATQIINYKTLETLTTKTKLHIDFGGGIKSLQDVENAFNKGAKQITVGSIAALQSTLMLEWLNRFGADKIILGADCKNRKIATNGWSESSDLDILSFIKEYEKEGATYSIVTDIDKDGMLAGPSFELYKQILSQSKINLIASGGITTMDDVVQLKEMGCEGAIIGKAIYEGTIKLKELSFLC
ncbi:1-(5-phosphoribosyl)-5-[(5-phosphoribosylamino)methylideneamino]imidazole-4-carboxamide isomerase [Taibaiella sp. KBW10]|uniref:1-(5-phosphoribosyl)-5-[(5- phosphoribosylamino)methylideneamino]imidazole-4- carboxamide isomerase n=1 Tax=Taibaiella sp. KBW10 TaxID=2153357 RepID=UPI000F5B4069|nr:1-(5-phosphoribosyl)-5-[(5-phosphoribosylamino)methylideneamino]imidazole-4-carboxamide isomerase [Taibaiella sp. KBW10]RQO32092.1 1-(5-phosphoribosyl)-5-[(5-phosphoribosylamino)methylideneamino]imidazole-4-carboxamide isomerase [Taibaiella sp. KBW10]